MAASDLAVVDEREGYRIVDLDRLIVMKLTACRSPCGPGSRNCSTARGADGPLPVPGRRHRLSLVRRESKDRRRLNAQANGLTPDLLESGVAHGGAHRRGNPRADARGESLRFQDNRVPSFHAAALASAESFILTSRRQREVSC